MRILLFDPINWDYNAESAYRVPLGGSQSAACYLSAELARSGNEVSLLTRTSDPGMHRGVDCRDLSRMDAKAVRTLRADVVIIILGVIDANAFRHWIGPSPRIVLWTQHAHDQPSVQPLADQALRDSYDGVALVSEWQRATFRARFGLHPARTAVFGNGVGPPFQGLFAGGTAILSAKDQPPVVAYTSTPFRGLDLLLEAFPEIRRQVPGTRLKVFSSMKVYQVPTNQDHALYGALYDRCRSTEGAEYIGSLPQTELAKQLRSVTALAYPNTFPETFCISALEAMATGCRVVSSELGALPQTTAGFGSLVPIIGRPRNEYLEHFVQETVYVLRHAREQHDEEEQFLRRQVDYVNTACTWAGRAREWMAWLEVLCGQAGATVASRGST